MFDVPKFGSKDDPELWIYRYNKAAAMNKWDDKTKLFYVDNCFKETLQLWFMQQDFHKWEEFKTAFLLKFTKRVNIDKLVSSIINLKMTSNETISDYILRFEGLKNKYLLESAKRKQQKNIKAADDKGKERESKEVVVDSPEEDFIDLRITENGFLNYFIKGIQSKSMKRFLRTEKPRSLKEAYDILEEVYGPENTEDSDSHTDDGTSYEINSSSDESEHDVKPSTNKTPSKKPNKKDSNSSSATDTEKSMSRLVNEFKNMTLLIGELVTKTNQNGNTPIKNNKPSCWNCLTSDHLTKDCTKPCKLCNQNGHKHYECTLYKKNKPTNNVQQGSESMLIEEILLSEKRKISDTDLENVNDTRNVRVSRSGKTVETPNLKRSTVRTSSNNPNALMLPSLESEPYVPKKSSRVKNLQASPNHPFTRPTTSTDVNAIKAKTEQILDRLFHDSKHELTLDEIAVLSPSARTGFKSRLTKPQVKKINEITNAMDKDTSALLVEINNELPKGKSAPRTKGWINGEPCEVILDGGCTSFIISLNFAKQLGIREVYPINTTVMFGDGASHSPVGLIKNLRVQVGDSEVLSVDALCFDVTKYNFIVGREGLHLLKIGTDWASHFWYIKREEGTVPLDTYYTEVPTRETIDTEDEIDPQDDDYEENFVDQDDVEEGYLIIEVSDDEDEVVPLKPNDSNRFGQLIDNVKNQDNLNKEEKDALVALLYKYEDCFGTNYEHLSQTNLLKFHVDTGNAKPIYKRPYSFLSFSEKEDLKKDLEDMVNNGILTPNMHVPGTAEHSGWSFPCRYVPKKTGDKRLISNFRELNAVTVRDTWPLPNVVDVIESLAGSKWFAVLDLLKAFQQIAVEENSIPKLTIATPWGSYSYRCVPFGVLNGPAVFSRCVFLAIQPFLGKFATNYLDDVTIYSKTKEEQFDFLEKFFARMREVNLKMNANKCEFFKNKITLLGFEVSEQGISPSPSKIAKIQNFPRPNNETAIRAFVNLCGFYRRHIPGFADIAAPMNELLKKKNPFIWNESCENSFVSLKESLVNAVALVLPDANTKYNLYCDASEVGIGACLATMTEEGERPVVFLSRKLQPAETRYPTVEKELLAIIYALKKLRKYLLDREFTLYCDNTAVCYLFNKNEPSQRLQRWVMCTQEFQFKIVHLPSTKNSVADALSRFPPKTIEDDEDGEDCIDALFDHLLMEEGVEPQYETWLSDLIFYFNFPGHPQNTPKIKRLSLKYLYQDHKLYRKIGMRFVLVPSITQRRAIMNEVHDGHGHYGVNASWARLYKDYWWPSCYQDMREHIRTCRECQLFSTRTPNAALSRVPIHYIFEQFALDFVGPFTKSNADNYHILVAVECFTCWPIAIATPNTEAKTVANFLYKHIFCQFGPPTHILTDNGSAFDNEIIDNFLNLLNVHHKFTAPYRPSTNGRNEQMNGNIVKALKKLAIDNPKDWDEHLDAVLYAYRTKAHSVLKISPYEFMFGIAPNSARMDPLQLLGRALGMERLVELNDRNVQIDDHNALQEYDPKPTVKRKYFEPGTQVVRFRHNKHSKLDSHFKPEVFTVVSCFANGTCQLADQMGRLIKRRVNISSLRKIHSRE